MIQNCIITRNEKMMLLLSKGKKEKDRNCLRHKSIFQTKHPLAIAILTKCILRNYNFATFEVKHGAEKICTMETRQLIAAELLRTKIKMSFQCWGDAVSHALSHSTIFAVRHFNIVCSSYLQIFSLKEQLISCIIFYNLPLNYKDE